MKFIFFFILQLVVQFIGVWLIVLGASLLLHLNYNMLEVFLIWLGVIIFTTNINLKS